MIINNLNFQVFYYQYFEHTLTFIFTYVGLRMARLWRWFLASLVLCATTFL